MKRAMAAMITLATVQAVKAGFVADFGNGDVSMFTEDADSVWTAQGGVYNMYRDTGTGSTRYTDRTLTELTGFTHGTNFTISTRFMLDDKANRDGVQDVLEFEVLFLANSDATSAYGVGFRPIESVDSKADANQLFIGKGDWDDELCSTSDPDHGGPAAKQVSFTVVLDQWYTLTIEGTTSGTDLVIDVTVNDGNSDVLATSWTDTSGSVLTGDYFGYGTRQKRTLGDVDFDDFTVTWPELPAGGTVFTLR